MSSREQQLEYSELMTKMKNEEDRRRKGEKIAAVLFHFLGLSDLSGLVVADIGTSLGFVADELRARGARVVGFDIDRPGLVRAHERFGDRIVFMCADGEQLPVRDRAFDVVIFNHIYEHVVDPEAVMAEIHRILKLSGVVYLGFGNRLGVIEPHYRLPFLSYLPPKLADRYVRSFGRADEYYERLRSRRGLRKLARQFRVWDYTYSVLSEPHRFASDDLVPPSLARVPPSVWRIAGPILPAYVWVGAKDSRRPAGPPLRSAPVLVDDATG